MENLEHQASTLFAAKEFAKALEIYQLLFKGNPQNEQYAIACGNCYDATGNKEDAVYCYREALRINRCSEAALLNLSTIYYELKKYDLSEEYALKVLKINDKNVAAWQNLANIAFCNAHYDDAMFYYQKMYNNNPNSYIAMINMANTYYCMGKYVLALDFAKKSLQRHPSSVNAYILAGNSLCALGKYEKAIDMYSGALDLDADNPELLNSLSEAYRNVNDWEQALLYGWKFLKTKGNDEDAAHLNFGYLLYECYCEKSQDMAKKFALKWMKFFPDNSIALHTGNALLGKTSVQSLTPDFIKKTFDYFAQDFEKTLSDLEYQAPALIFNILRDNFKTSFFTKYHILDLGCGTGLCGEKIKDITFWHSIIGVDLSEKMLDIARNKNIYAHLICDDICSYMENSCNLFHIITAADVLTYFGDLTKVFVRISRSLLPEGVFAFTFSENEQNSDDFLLAPSGRFIHSPTYVEKVLKSAGLRLISWERCILRNEAEIPVYGYVAIAQKPRAAG